MLLKQLEEDLKNDEISEEDMALLERELEGALDDFDAELLNSDTVETPTSKDGNDGPLE